MGAPIPLRRDYDGLALCVLARQSKDADQTRRLLALASIYDGGSRSVAAKLGGVGLQIVRDWVLNFNALGPKGLIDRKAPGQPAKLDAAQRQALAEKVERGPVPAGDGMVRWRLKDLVQWIFEDFGISLDETTVGRELAEPHRLRECPKFCVSDVAGDMLSGLSALRPESNPRTQPQTAPSRQSIQQAGASGRRRCGLSGTAA